MKICLINKYFLPDQGITARAAFDLLQYLSDFGHELFTVSTEAHYGQKASPGELFGHHSKIKARYNGKNKFLRLLASCLEARSLVREALKLDADIYIVMTSPPLLNYFACRQFRRRNKRWIYWSMDLYPEAFSANGLVKPSNPIYNYIYNAVYTNPPHYMLALGPQQKQFLKSAYRKDIPGSILPCGVFAFDPKTTEGAESLPEWKTDPEKTYFAYIGNLGEAHSPEFLHAFIKALNPDQHRLLLAVYGSKASETIAFARKFKAVYIREYIQPEEFDHIDVHLASLLPEWVHICVPSKLVSAVSQGAAFLYYGPDESDSWNLLGEAGWLVGDVREIPGFLDSLDRQSIQYKKEKAQLKAEELKKMLLEGYSNLQIHLKKE